MSSITENNIYKLIAVGIVAGVAKALFAPPSYHASTGPALELVKGGKSDSNSSEGV